MMVCFNLHWGPWEGCRWQHEAAGAIKELVSVMQSGDHLSSWLTPEILSDWGELDRRHEEDIEQEVWSRVPFSETFSCRGPKCSLTRWMGWLDAACAFDKGWHSRLAAYIINGL